jgi:hypothetical protein
MHGHHGWGHHFGGGFGRHWGGGGWGLGWFFPALLLGQLISNTTRPAGWPYPPQPTGGPWGTPQPEPGAPTAQPSPAAAAPRVSVHCDNCSADVDGTYAFCPHCGAKIAQRDCRYCDQVLEPGARHCGYCGGSVK